MSESTKAMPPAVNDLFEALKSEVVWLHARWILYRQLYGTNPERIELLNSTASYFFAQLEWVLLDDILLGLSRLTDRLETCGHSNLVLGQLPERLSESKWNSLVANLSQRLESIKAKCDSFRNHRNRRIAHCDLQTAQGSVERFLHGISREMVEDALAEIRAFMNEVQSFFDGSETAYEHFLAASDGDALIFALKRGYEYGELQSQGIVPWDQLEKSKYHKA